MPGKTMEGTMSIKMRQHVEREIVTAAIRGLLDAGHDLSVHDTESYQIRNSRDADAVLAAMLGADEEYLYADKRPDANAGWVRFIYGNDGWDVINDYTTNLEDALKEANARAEFWSK